MRARCQAPAGDPVFQRRQRWNREAAAYWIVRSSRTMTAPVVSFRGALATKQSPLSFLPRYGLLRGACHRAALRADPLARNDGIGTAYGSLRSQGRRLTTASFAA